MQSIRYLIVAALSVVFPACDDAQAPTDVVGQGPQHAIHVNNIAEFKAALQSGRSWIIVDQPLVFSNAADRIVLDDLCLPHNCPPTVTIEGGSGWYGAVFWRCAHFPEPLLEARNTRPWEIRLKGLFFANGPASASCPEVYTGRALNLGSIRHSILDDVRFQGFESDSAVLIGNLGETRNVEFRDIGLMWNNHPMRIMNASGVHWRGGHNQTDWWSGWSSGLEIFGDAVYGGPITIDDFHMEGGHLHVEGNGIVLRGGYFWNTNNWGDPPRTGVRLWGTNVRAECNGVFAHDLGRVGGTPMLWVNGAARCYSEQNLLPPT